MNAEVLLNESIAALGEAGYAQSLGTLSERELEEMSDSNRKLVCLELFVQVLGLASAKLPRYVAALEMHANLADRPGAADAAEVPTMRLGVAGLVEALKVIKMVKTEATDMAKKLDKFSED